VTAIKPRFFSTPPEFRAWLVTHHENAVELWVGFYKKGSGKPSITWPESVDEALCFGWIDGVRKSLGDESYVIRFTPRKPRSIWSNVNLAKVTSLIAEGRMTPAGLAAYARRDPARSGIYAFERETATFEPADRKLFEQNRAAWKFFEAQPAYYRQVATHYVASAKKAETRARRLAALIDHSAKGERLPRYLSAKKPT
jgi:uncharacterized protein YdeI (YjbR/CyaY-like superfamily)